MDFLQPGNTVEYHLMREVVHGVERFFINCRHLEKELLIFGDFVWKVSPLQTRGACRNFKTGLPEWVTAYFDSAEQAESQVRKMMRNSLQKVKTIRGAV